MPPIPLHKTAKSGNHEELQDLLTTGADPDARDDRGRTPLHLAAAEGHLKVVEILTQHGADFLAVDANGDSPVFTAAAEGQIEVVSFFLDQGLDPNVRNGAQFTVLHLLARHAGAHKVTTIPTYQDGRQVNIRNSAYIENYLKRQDPYGGMFKRYFDIATLLLENGAEVDSRTDQQFTPLIFSATHGPVDFVDLFIKYGAAVNTTDGDGLTPLHYAARLQKMEVVIALVENGAKINVRDRYGFTPLHEAAEAGKLSRVRYLIENGAEIDAKLSHAYAPYEKGDTPRDVGIKAGHTNAVRMLDKLVELIEKGLLIVKSNQEKS